MKTIKYIFFDNDGILVDTEPLFFDANRQILIQNGYKLTLEEHADINMAQGKSVLKTIAKDESHLKELTAQRDIVYLDLIRRNPKKISIKNAELCLQKLSPFFQMGIVTSSRRNTFQAIHQQTNICSFMDFIITRDDITRSKPNPEGYLKALEICQITPEEALVIEDSERGVLAAHDAGIQCWAIPRGPTKKQNFQKAKKVLNDITEIVKHLS